MIKTEPTLYSLILTLALLGNLLPLTGCTRSSLEPRHVAVSMKQFAITPAEIRLRQGETVQFEVVTEDVQHGFTVTALGINQAVNPGRPAIFLYEATKRGRFVLECGIMCGRGHEVMRAQIIVE